MFKNKGIFILFGVFSLFLILAKFFIVGGVLLILWIFWRQKLYYEKDREKNLLKYGIEGSSNSLKLEKDQNGDYYLTIFYKDYLFKSKKIEDKYINNLDNLIKNKGDITFIYDKKDITNFYIDLNSI